MPKAGYCAECGTNVWLREDGACERGHPASSIYQHYEAEAPAAVGIESSQQTVARPKRTRFIIFGIVAALLLVVGLCGLGSMLLRPLANKGSAAASEWNERLAKDYPGWKKVGFYVNSFMGPGEPETTYTFAMVPPGRNFPIAVAYKSTGGGAPVSQDEIFRAGAAFPDRASSLLDYIDTNYIQKGRDVAAVTSDAKGVATVTWRKVRRILFFTSTTGSFDELTYNEQTGRWAVSFAPGG